MLKRLIALAVVTTAIAVAVGLYSRRVVTQEVDTATLSGQAWQAQAQGQSEVSLSRNILFEGVDDLNSALSQYSVIEATPIAKQSYVLDDFNIGTWYKFRVQSTLKQNPLTPCSDCPPLPDPPADMLPLNAGEILVLHPGGLQVINGVTFDITVPDFPDFNLNQNYLLFIDFDASRGVGSVSVGPPGVYTIDGYGKLSHIYGADPDDPIGSGLAASYGNNVNNLNNALNPPPPPTCDPVQEQNCYDQGGDWNPSTCRCYIPPDPCARRPWLCY
jgi:hypothetical protein